MKEERKDQRQVAVAQVSIIGMLANFLLSILKFVIGFLCRSQGMMADSMNSIGDVLASFMSFIGGKISAKPKDEDHPYGHGKAEYIFSLLISVAMVVAAIEMFKNALKSLIKAEGLTFSYWLIIICGITIMFKVLLYVYTKNKKKQYPNILLTAQAEDHRNDIFVTCGTLVGIVSSCFGWYFVDGIVGCLISVWIAFVGMKLFKDAYHVLMDTGITEEQEQQIRCLLLDMEDVIRVDAIRSNPVGQNYVIMIEIAMNQEKTLAESHKIANKIEKMVIRKIPYVVNAFVHINPSKKKEKSIKTKKV